MELLSHLLPQDYKALETINDAWPLQFLSEFTRFHKNYYRDDIVILKDEETGGFLPLRLLRMKFFKHAQIMHAPAKMGEELSAECQLRFFNNMLVYLKKSGIVERLVQPHPYGILAAFPPGSRNCRFGTYIIDLKNQSEDEILSKFTIKYQKAISHSIRNGAVVKLGKETLDDFYQVYTRTMRRANMKPDYEQFFQMQYNYLTDRRACSGVVYEDGKPVSGIFIIHSEYSALVTHAGSVAHTKLYGAGKLLNFEMMKYMKSLGVARYDFVGVRLNNTNPALEGIFKFKKGFGGDLKAGYLWKAEIDKKRTHLFDSLMRIKLMGNKVPDIIDQVSS